MKRILNGLILTVLILSVSVSCNNNSDNIFGCHVDKVHAEKSIHFNASSVIFEKQPLIEVINLHTIDSFLVVKGNVKDCAGQMFIFNLNDKKYTGGSFISKGRGPNELHKPCCLGQYGNSSEQNSLYIFDLSHYKAYSFNVEESVKRGETVLSEICKLPDGTLYAYPFRDSLHFIKKPGPDCLDGMVLNQHGGLSETVALYREIPDLMYFDKLSSTSEPKSATWAL